MFKIWTADIAVRAKQTETMPSWGRAGRAQVLGTTVFPMDTCIVGIPKGTSFFEHDMVPYFFGNGATGNKELLHSNFYTG